MAGEIEREVKGSDTKNDPQRYPVAVSCPPLSTLCPVQRKNLTVYSAGLFCTDTQSVC